MNFENTSDYLLLGKIGVIPTDTIYGVAALALSQKTVERAYRVLKRDKNKPFIILIGSIRDLALFKIKLDNNTQKILEQIWPGKISVVLPVVSHNFRYLHRGTKTLAFRIPKKQNLLKLLKKTGPLISTSANPQGKKPTETITEAKKYFGEIVDPVRKNDISKAKKISPKIKISRKLAKPKLSNGVDFYISNGKIKSLPSTIVEIKDGKMVVLRKGAGKLQNL
jgi:L-threonylcarbamoyladenylate synthase